MLAQKGSWTRRSGFLAGQLVGWAWQGNRSSVPPFYRDELVRQAQVTPNLVETADWGEGYSVLQCQGKKHWRPSGEPTNV